MRTYCFLVKFKIGNEVVHSFCDEEAKILAQAERIKKGMTYRDIEDCYKVD